MSYADEWSAMGYSAPPVDLYGLHLLRLVAEHQSVTGAAVAAGLTQSAVTRQVKNIEERIGAVLFERTTRRLQVTEAGRTLLRETEQIPAALDAAIRQAKAADAGIPQELRVGVSRSVTFAHLPGLLHGHLRRPGGVRLEVSHLDSGALLEAVAAGGLDAGILGAPRHVPDGCRITHRMPDRFTLIAPADMGLPVPATRGRTRWTKRMRGALEEATWLLPSPAMQTRQEMDAWFRREELPVRRSAGFDSFDLIVHLVALGLGVALVPRRAIAGFPRKSRILTWLPPDPFERRLVVVTRRSPAPHVRSFVESILFS